MSFKSDTETIKEVRNAAPDRSSIVPFSPCAPISREDGNNFVVGSSRVLASEIEPIEGGVILTSLFWFNPGLESINKVVLWAHHYTFPISPKSLIYQLPLVPPVSGLAKNHPDAVGCCIISTSLLFLNSQFSSANQVEAIGRVLRTPVSPIPVLSHRWQTVGTNKQQGQYEIPHILSNQIIRLNKLMLHLYTPTKLTPLKLNSNSFFLTPNFKFCFLNFSFQTDYNLFVGKKNGEKISKDGLNLSLATKKGWLR